MHTINVQMYALNVCHVILHTGTVILQGTAPVSTAQGRP